MSPLPAIGTVFSSVDDFKLASFKSALSESYVIAPWRWITSSGAPPRSELRCNGLGSRKAGKGQCTAFVAAKQRDDRKLVVFQRSTTHSCCSDSEKEKTARTEMRRKIGVLEVAAEQDSSDSSTVGEDKSDAASTSEEDKEEGEEDNRFSTPTQTGRFPLKRSSDGPLPSTSSLVSKRARPSDPREAARAYDLLAAVSKPLPDKRMLRQGIEELKASGYICLPSPGDVFSTAADFFTCVFALAEQHGFATTRHTQGGRTRFVCDERIDGVRCKWALVARRDEGDGWRIFEVEDDHTCDATNGTASTSTHLSSPPRQSLADTSTSSAAAFPLQSRPSPSKPLFTLPTISTTAMGPPPPPRIDRSHPLSEKDLLALFLTTAPPSAAATSARLLSTSGVTTLELLIDLLSCEDGTVDAMGELMVKQGTVIEEEKTAVLGVLRKMKEEMEG